MSASPFFIACGGLAWCLIIGHAEAQILSPPRSEPKIPDWVQKQDSQDAAKSQQQMFDTINKSNPGIPKEPLIPRLDLKPPTFGAPAGTVSAPSFPSQQSGAPARQYSPRAGPQAVSNAPAPPVAQPALSELRRQAAPSAPAKTPCVYKAVMTNDEIAACR